MSAPEIVDVDIGPPEPAPVVPFRKAKPAAVSTRAPDEGFAPQPEYEPARVQAKPAPGRTLPHSIAAEQNLLSVCLLDGADVVARCLDARIGPASFYDPKHGVIFARLLDLYNRKAPIDIAIVAEELKTSRQLDVIGGYPFLEQVSRRIPTTIEAGTWIEKVREQALLREIIRSAIRAAEDCYGFTGGIEDFVAGIEGRFHSLANGMGERGSAFDLDKLMKFDGKHDPDCLMGRRFLGRTCACVIVAPSGIGKSVLALQLGASAAIARPFFGMQMSLPMRVLYIQAEDDFGDVGESLQGFVRGFKVSDDEWKQLRERLRIVRWNDAAGDKFLGKLRREFEKWPFDLAIVNPLFSFAGCNVSDQKELSPFLRNGLNPILNDTRAAAVIVHHTNKPPTDPKQKPADTAAELRYSGSGSAELTNWARAYLTLQPVRSAGDRVHKLVFAKRGHRAGIVDADGKPATSLMIEHSTDGLCWLPSDYSVEQGPGGKFVGKFDLTRAAQTYDPDADWMTNEQAIATDQDVDRRTVRRHRQNILDTVP